MSDEKKADGLTDASYEQRVKVLCGMIDLAKSELEHLQDPSYPPILFPDLELEDRREQLKMLIDACNGSLKKIQKSHLNT